MFRFLYFDSNILLAAPWPRLSATIENILKTAPAADVTVIIPAPVEEELAHHWIRGFNERLRTLTAAADAFQGHYRNVSELELDLGLPPSDYATTLYQQRIGELKEKYGIQSAPFTSRSLADVFAMACLYQPPFRRIKEGDVGFRDAVIFLSVIDHLAPRKRTPLRPLSPRTPSSRTTPLRHSCRQRVRA